MAEKRKQFHLYVRPGLEDGLRKVYEDMKRQGIPADYDGEMNVSAVVNYLVNSYQVKTEEKSNVPTV